MFFRHFRWWLVCFFVSITSCTSIDYDSKDVYLADYTGQDDDSFTYTSGVEKRYGINSDCRRCMFRRDDWRSCWSCYSRPGPIPFYGGFAKRSESSMDDGGHRLTSAYSDIVGHSRPLEKKSFSYCQCCLRSPSTNWFCCQNCNLIPFYGGYRKRSEHKRGYETSFVPLELTGVGVCDRCCSRSTFDFYCCVFSCGGKRRK